MDAAALRKHTNVELKRALSNRNLETDGKKEVLVQRLAQSRQPPDTSPRRAPSHRPWQDDDDDDDDGEQGCCGECSTACGVLLDSARNQALRVIGDPQGAARSPFCWAPLLAIVAVLVVLLLAPLPEPPPRPRVAGAPARQGSCVGGFATGWLHTARRRLGEGTSEHGGGSCVRRACAAPRRAAPGRRPPCARLLR